MSRDYFFFCQVTNKNSDQYCVVYVERKAMSGSAYTSASASALVPIYASTNKKQETRKQKF